MQKIFQLPEPIISKIAAGEVIQRPSFAVKELIDNAIDAGATVIEIHIEENGLRKIVLIDNGEGMSREDLELSFLPHTTSKIRSEEDLVGIRTLGFRGEALSSISAISNLSIQTRTKDSIAGTKVNIQNGKLQEVTAVGMPIGTIVTAENLFSNVPARKKFLKSQKTEFRHITTVVTNYTLSYPQIHFVLLHNKKTIFDLAKKTTITDRIAYILGESTSNQLVSVQFEEGYIHISGFVGKPQIASRNSQKQFIFVNNRSVSDKLISLAVSESFGMLLPARNTPVFLLSLTIPHEIVDVNIHPRKEHISFVNAKAIFDAVKQAVSQALTDNNLTFHLAKFKGEVSARLGETTSLSGFLLKQHVLQPSQKTLGLIKTNSSFMQLADTYIIAITSDGMLLIDQHAAHERILFEQFVKEFASQKNKRKVMRLSKPLTFTLSIRDAQILDEYHKNFEKIGIHFEHFQGSSYLLRSMPKIFKGRNIEKIIHDMLSDLEDETSIKTIDTRSQRMLAFLSCRAAVKAGDPLTQIQMKELVTKLERSESNVTCPHGRPTKVNLSIDQIHNTFKR